MESRAGTLTVYTEDGPVERVSPDFDLVPRCDKIVWHAFGGELRCDKPADHDDRHESFKDGMFAVWSND